MFEHGMHMKYESKWHTRISIVYFDETDKE